MRQEAGREPNGPSGLQMPGRLVLWLLLLQPSAFGLPTPTTFPLASPRLSVLGLSAARGIFDPSLIATGNPAFPFALALSAVEATANISTALAVYDAALGSFVRVAAVNAAQGPAIYPCVGGAPCTATLIHEVPSLVADPTDPSSSRAIKVFSHTYLVLPSGELHYELGYIALHTAPAVSGPWASTPLLGWASSSPLSTAGVAQVLTDLPELRDCLAFSEPGALLTARGLLLALTCVSAPSGPARIRVVLLSSSDHGSSWAYSGLALDGSDAPSLGNFTVPQLSAPNLFTSATGGTYLSVTPAAPLWDGFVGYSGCYVVQLNAEHTGVVRDAAGAPVVEQIILPDGLAFNGACTAAVGAGNASAAGDFYVSVLLQGEGEPFSIVPTRIAAGGKRGNQLRAQL